ncbi:tyrosine-protein phosphatase [Levilactobacillus suantsaii]|uniref:Tyrosine-protein phosphatase n=1 Tax=Levilactobacillus suantsaii TaxID=2292255 RepID=A0A4Q0VH53_9LACO|nr:tyrosine-protein phosphatase [Levilactobacillus suantsaii]QMU08547.1 tyrosine-protein phosphatase [Levilactobacillus suantsaii]RXI78459.1 tyrosine-protein phosphatase [Levilactobacillus suantsaii]
MILRRVLLSVSCALALFGATGSPALAAATTATDTALQPTVSQTKTPAINLTGAPNARDMGGYRTKSGQKVRLGRLLRSDSLDKLTAGDMVQLQSSLHLKQVVDLRTTDQIKKSPDQLIEGVNYLQASVLGTRSNYDDDDTGMYHDMAFKPAAKRSYHTLLTLMAAQKKGSLLFHCSHGMDRTGTAAAIIYTILGVSRRDIQRDYLLSNTQLNVTWAKPALLNQFFQDVKGQYGSMSAYIHKGLKITPAQEKAIRHHYLTPAHLTH